VKRPDRFGRVFTHDCAPPLLGRRPFVCPICRRTWMRRSATGWWSENDETTEGEIESVTMRYPDGSTQTFTSESTTEPIR